ncbi:MAG: hypothetical protein ACNA7W_13160 [Pseudomonadales bacterium]
MDSGIDDVRQRVHAVAERFSAERDERRQRTALDPRDFTDLAEAGFLLTGVPVSMGGLWQGLGASVRGYCDLLVHDYHGPGGR